LKPQESKNHRFWVFETLGIKEPWVPGVWHLGNQRTISSGYLKPSESKNWQSQLFQGTQRNRWVSAKNRQRTSGFLGSLFLVFLKKRTTVIKVEMIILGKNGSKLPHYEGNFFKKISIAIFLRIGSNNLWNY
jgi:hypothetical protein